MFLRESAVAYVAATFQAGAATFFFVIPPALTQEGSPRRMRDPLLAFVDVGVHVAPQSSARQKLTGELGNSELARDLPFVIPWLN